MPIFVDDTLLTREETATLLGVSAQRVSALCAKGLLTAYTFGRRQIFIALDSVKRYKQCRSQNGRAYEPSLSFAALFMLSGYEVSWINKQQKDRIRAYLCATHAQELVNRTKTRANMVEYWCRATRLADLSEHLMLSAATGEMSSQFQLTCDINKVEGYINKRNVELLIRKFHLKSREEGAYSSITNVKLRIVQDSSIFECIKSKDYFNIAENLKATGADVCMPIAVCAADLAESLDVRERNAGLNKLTELLEQYNHVSC